jgi:thiol-disulfide isomerase/thioredoxin
VAARYGRPVKIVAGILGFVAFVALLIGVARFLAAPAGVPADARVPAPPVPTSPRVAPMATAPAAPAAPADARAPHVNDGAEAGDDDANTLPALFVYQDDAHPAPIALAGPRKRPALLHLWASWCGPCRAELPSILKRGKQGDVDVIAVSVDDHFVDVRHYFNDKIPPEVVWDKTITLEKALGTETIPNTFLIDTRGVVVDRFDGAQEWTAPDVERRLRDDLAAARARAKL